MPSSRRTFLLQSGAALAASYLSCPYSLRADPLRRGIGLQLYTVIEQLAKDFEGTLKQVAAIGYKEVEMAGFFGKTAAEIKAVLDRTGLKCRGVHVFGSASSLKESIDFARGLGASYVVSSTTLPNLSISERSGRFAGMTFLQAAYSLRLEDYNRMAEYCNHLGEQVREAGLQFAYHNHDWEFASMGGTTGYDELLRLSDPHLVKFELDCGWMVLSGHDPAAYLTKYPHRYRLLHIKDFKPSAHPVYRVDLGSRPDSTELGHGHIDYKPIFAAARKAQVDWYFVEQEPPFKDMPAMDAIRVDYNYLHSLNT